MAAFIIGAIDEQAANTHFTHFAERDFLPGGSFVARRTISETKGGAAKEKSDKASR